MKIEIFHTKTLRNYLLAGLIIWLPIIATIVILRFIIDLLDNTIALLPSSYRPEHLFGIYIPGLGILFSLILLIGTGIIVTNILGQRLFNFGEMIFTKIPFVNVIYKTAKQIIAAIFSNNSQAFHQVVLVEYPRTGLWSLGFLTNEEINLSPNTEKFMTVYVPTTPNPTSGFLLLMPRKDVHTIEMTVEQAIKFIISLGVMYPISTENHNVSMK